MCSAGAVGWAQLRLELNRVNGRWLTAEHARSSESTTMAAEWAEENGIRA
jgi:hypothetical protein